MRLLFSVGSGTRHGSAQTSCRFHIHAVGDHQNFAAAVKKVVEPMGKTSLVLDMVHVQVHESGQRLNEFLLFSCGLCVLVIMCSYAAAVIAGREMHTDRSTTVRTCAA